ncbi:caspase family protein [Streptomyces sp. NPDC020403]|uniref:effector-associated domain 2-containing protein n=1 Tax=unclassified Streptomyces TaxID=2593676 RepID=UPI003402F1C6
MNRAPVRPDRVAALVVGIEQYAAGPDWDLPGPARDALRFRDWLLARGVPGAGIQLHLAPLPGTEPDVPYLPADHASLRRALVTDMPARGGDALWVWWGGHGVLDRKEHLRLYSADATVTDRRNIDVESARDAYRSDAVPAFGRQMWMIDACRTFDERHNFPQTLPHERFATGARVQEHEQVLIFATGRGQRAANDPGRRLGVFSDIVLSELPPDPLPDPAALFAAVEARMSALPAAGHALQLPTVFMERPGWARNIAPPPPPAPAPRPPAAGRALARLIDALLAYSLMNDRDERQALVNELPPSVVARMPRHTMPRTDVIGIVRTLRARPEGLWELYDAVTLLDDDPGRSAELKAAVEDFAAGPGSGM